MRPVAIPLHPFTGYAKEQAHPALERCVQRPGATTRGEWSFYERGDLPCYAYVRGPLQSKFLHSPSREDTTAAISLIPGGDEDKRFAFLMVNDSGCDSGPSGTTHIDIHCPRGAKSRNGLSAYFSNSSHPTTSSTQPEVPGSILALARSRFLLHPHVDLSLFLLHRPVSHEISPGVRPGTANSNMGRS